MANEGTKTDGSGTSTGTSGRGGMHFGGEPTPLWGKARREPRFRLEGSVLVHTNGNRCKWHVERRCWISA